MNTDIAEQIKRYFDNTPLEQVRRDWEQCKDVYHPPTQSTGHFLEFHIGQTVYLKTDEDQLARMVTGIFLRPNNSVSYCLTLGTNETYHYGIEIDEERDIVKATSN